MSVGSEEVPSGGYEQRRIQKLVEPYETPPTISPTQDGVTDGRTGTGGQRRVMGLPKCTDTTTMKIGFGVIPVFRVLNT